MQDNSGLIAFNTYISMLNPLIVLAACKFGKIQQRVRLEQHLEA
jgi:hypothetical protein